MLKAMQPFPFQLNSKKCDIMAILLRLAFLYFAPLLIFSEAAFADHRLILGHGVHEAFERLGPAEIQRCGRGQAACLRHVLPREPFERIGAKMDGAGFVGEETDAHVAARLRRTGGRRQG